MLLAPDAPNRFAPDAHNNPTCPIWDGLKIVSIQFPAVEKNILADGSRYYSSRAGGPFLLMKDGAALLDWESPFNEQKSLTVGQKVNLSYWIYQHNLDSRLLDELSSQNLQEPGGFKHWMNDHRDRVLELDKAWVEGHRDRTPSAEDRMLMFLRESIRDWDAGDEEREPNSDLKMAAGGCRTQTDLEELENHAAEQKWLGVRTESGFKPTRRVNLPARIHVEEKTREQDPRKQVFAGDAPDEREFDVFISHTTEDKADVARPLAEALRDAGLRVWYDEFELKIGHSLRHKIDKGLAASRFGVVVLSPAFFGRGWTEYELNGLVTQTVSREQDLLPVWHNVTGHEVMEYSPSLADRFALSTETHTVEAISAAIVDVIRNT